MSTTHTPAETAAREAAARRIRRTARQCPPRPPVAWNADEDRD